MNSANQLVENLLDAEPDEVDPKEMVNAMRADAEDQKTRGPVNASTAPLYGTIWHRTAKNSDGTATRAKVTSIKTWKTRPGEFEIGWKHGLYGYGKMTPQNASEWTTIEPPPVPSKRTKR